MRCHCRRPIVRIRDMLFIVALATIIFLAFEIGKNRGWIDAEEWYFDEETEESYNV